MIGLTFMFLYPNDLLPFALCLGGIHCSPHSTLVYRVMGFKSGDRSVTVQDGCCLDRKMHPLLSFNKDPEFANTKGKSPEGEKKKK